LSFGKQTAYRIFKKYSESLFPDGSRHILLRQKPVSAAEKPLGSELLLSRWVFSVQDGARQKFKIDPEPSGNRLSEYVF
jgi:hypothetical protein